jgi:predicted O-methyltransferase YrrM
MTHHFYQFKEAIRYKINARHHKGFGIHSPYLFHFITSVLQEKHPFYCFETIESLRKDLDNRPTCFGRQRKAHNGQIIFRIIQDAKYKTLLEIGTSSGIETQYMAFANQKARCISVTDSAESAAVARKGFQIQGLRQIELHLLKPEDRPEKFIENLDNLDFVLFNQIHDPQKYQALFKECLCKKNNGSIFVFMNMHESPAKTQAWENIRIHQDVQVSIDLFNLGIILFNPELGKKKYVIRN